MAHVICEPCVGTKSVACVEVCPTDAIHPLPEAADFATETKLYIHPTDCIDCGLCINECPVKAIFPEDDVPAQWKSHIEGNAEYFRKHGKL